jgi:hypothetical protein
MSGEPPACRSRRLDANPRRKVASDDRNNRKDEQRDDVLRIRDGEGVQRRQKKPVIG